MSEMPQVVSALSRSLAALTQSVAAARKPSPVARCAASRWPTCISIFWRSLRSGSSASATRALCSFPVKAADAKYRRVPRRLPVSPRFPPERRAVGQPVDPDQHGVFLSQHAAEPGRRALSQPGRRDRIAVGVGFVERNRRPRIRCSQTMEPDVEALLIALVAWATKAPQCLLPRSAHAGRQEAHAIFWPRIDECFKLVGVIRANWRGLVRAEKRSGTRSTPFLSICAPDPASPASRSEQGPTQCPT